MTEPPAAALRSSAELGQIGAADQLISAAPLGNTRAHCVTLPDQDAGMVERRMDRFYLQSLSRELLPEERVADCMRRSFLPGRAVQIWYAPAVKRAHYVGLTSCASPWMCPVCAAKITERRRQELMDISEELPFEKLLLTFTLQHKRDDRLIDVLNVLVNSYRALKSGKAWAGFEFRYGIVGSVRGLEVTWGQENGYHPHIHALVYLNQFRRTFDIESMKQFLYERFASSVAKRGGYVNPTIGVDVQRGDEAMAYIAKGGWSIEAELTKAPVKKGHEGHYSMLDVLRMYGAGEAWAGSIYREYALTMKGRHQLEYSRGLKKLLGIEHQMTDEEIAAGEEPGAGLWSTLTHSEWQRALKWQKRWRDSRGELLEVASIHDMNKFDIWLRAKGIRIGGDAGKQ
jgi:hypothetical protein